MQWLRPIQSPSGTRITVGRQYADQFGGLLDDLEMSGYPARPGESGGYNHRNIAGTNRLSNHADGSAVDVNWTTNARGTKGEINPELARSLATKHGMTWGGDWSNPDPMHFEVNKGGAPQLPSLQLLKPDGTNSPQMGPNSMAMRPRGTRWDEALPVGDEGGEPWEESARTGIMPAPPMQQQAQPQMRGPAVGSYQARSPQMPEQQEQPSFLQEIVGRASNPLFQQGLGMFLAASQGKDLNAGMGAGTERATAMQNTLMNNLKVKREMAQRAAMQKLLQNGETFGGVPPAMLDMARATGDPSQIMQFMAKHPEMELERQKMQFNNLSLQEQIAARRADTDYKTSRRPLEDQKLQAEITALTEGKVKDSAAFRMNQLIDAGLDPKDDRNKVFIATGKMPREDQQPLTATDKKAILEAEEGVESARNSIRYLDEALKLSPKAYTGPTAGARGYVTSLFGSEEGKATEDLNNVVTTNALSSLKPIFGGNPTEGERKILLDIQGSANKSQAVRDEIFSRAKAAADRRLAFNQKRVDEMRNGTFYKPGAASTPAAAPSSAVGRLKFNPATGELE